MKSDKKYLFIGISFIFAFLLWTVLLSFVDKSAIGPNLTSVGFAAINGAFHKFTGINMSLYTITDWLSIVPILFIFGFGIVGLLQCIKRKSVLRVDRSILVLGVFYLVVLAFYLSFLIFVVNYRPTLIDGNLEASYPSSTTMLVMCVMPTAVMQLETRIKSKILYCCVAVTLGIFTAFMVAARLISGVHWLTDIIGGGLLSVGLVMLYKYFQAPSTKSF